MTSILRRPVDEEATNCAKLTYIAGPDLYGYLMVQKEPKIYDLFNILYKNPGNPSAKENVIVEEESGTIRGLIRACPASDLQQSPKNVLKMMREILRINGLLNFVKIAFRIKLNKYMSEVEDDEFFIVNLAVFEEYRRQGIARKLLEKAEEMAGGKSLSKLSLYVEINNPDAKKVYERFGFKEVKKVVLPKKYHKHNLFGFYKMVKEIGEI